MRDHDSLRVTEFRGLFDRGEDEACPADHFLSCQNLISTGRGTRTRYGTSHAFTKSNLRRIKIYKLVGEAQRLLILNNNYQLFDSTDLSTPILTVTGMTDFSVEVMYNRAYITPHNGVTGLSGEKVYVYTGSGTARAAAGVAPTGFTLTLTNSASSGDCDEGTHAIAVCFITNTGFITAPGGFNNLDFTGARKLDVANIQVGGSSVSKRILLATKAIADFNGDYTNQDWFFIPDGTINDNSTTSVTGLSFFDADLQESANYLFDQLSEIPAGVTIRNGGGRLIVGGENSNQSTARVSKKGEPESISASEGFINVNPGDAGFGLKNIFVHRESIYFCKSRRTYVATDNGEEAIFWNVQEVDGAVGAECHSVGQILDYGQTVEDITVIATRAGLKLFNGTFAPRALSWKIDDVWARINRLYFHMTEVAIDPENKLIYVNVVLDSATVPTHVLVADYSEGLDAKAVRWNPWVFPSTPASIVVNTKSTDSTPVFQYARYSGNIFSYDTLVQTDAVDSTPANNVVIDNWGEFPFLPHEADKKSKDGTYHFAGIVGRIKGSGSLDITMKGLDSGQTLTATSITLAASPGKEVNQIFDFSATRCSLKLRMDSAGEWFSMTKFTLLSRWVWGPGVNQV